MVGSSGPNAVYCDGTYSQQPPAFTNNDAFLSGGNGFDGTCASLSGQSGNLSTDPLFVNAAGGNFQVQTTSPAIDAGSNSASKLPQTDFATNPRILDGNNDCMSVVDQGVYEVVRNATVSFSASSLTFPNQPLGVSSSPMPVTLTNTGNGCFVFSSTTIAGDFSQMNSCATTGLTGGNSCVYNVIFTPAATGARSGVLTVTGSDGIKTASPSVSLSGVGTDFAVSAAPTSVSVKRGKSVKVTINVTPMGGTVSSSVALTCSGAPQATTCTLLPNSVVPGSSGATSVLTLSTTPRTQRGKFTLTVAGNSGSAQNTTTVTVTVN